MKRHLYDIIKKGKKNEIQPCNSAKFTQLLWKKALARVIGQSRSGERKKGEILRYAYSSHHRLPLYTIKEID